ncbi:MAG: insulinase family protein [Ferruginibacter sp.]|nr:insulinase family protein [Ferruginibacter sp.]
MKKIFFIAITALSMQASFAQVKVDRSKKPKAGAAPVISIKDPVIFNLSNGMTVLVVENHKFPKVNASLTIDAGPVKEGNKAGVLDLMGQMLGEGTTSMTKLAFDEAVDQIGADVNLSAGGASASALTRYFDQAFSLMADGLKHPSFPQASLDKLKQQMLTGLKNTEKSAPAIATRVANALSYGKTTAMGEFSTEETVKSINLQDIKNAYKDFITPSRSYLTFVGDITPAAAKALVEKNFGKWTGKKLALPIIADVKNPDRTEIDFIDVPTAVQAEIRAGNLITNPMNSNDYHALLLANQILGGGGDAKLFMNLREKHGFTYGSYSNVGSGRFQELFTAAAAVRTDKADSAVAEMVREILNMRDGKISQEELDIAKALYNGSFAIGMENPARSASFASRILINNLPKDFYRTFLQKINAVTLADIQRVSKAYFNETNSRIVIVGNGNKILPNLARLGYPIKKYDRYADPIVDKPVDVNAGATPMTTDKVSAYSIVEDFLKASGGKEEIKKIKSIYANIEVEMQGRSFAGADKRSIGGKSATELKMGQMTVFKKVFNGVSGYSVQGGQRIEMTEDEIKESLDEKAPIPQLLYTGADHKLEYLGAGTVGAEKTYRLKVTKPSGNVAIQHYSIKTGLLLMEEITKKQGAEEVTETMTYSDYRKVGNILLPFEILQNASGQEIPLKITSYKINEGITDEDFK